MKVNQTSSQNFNGINTLKAREAVYERLSNPKRFMQYNSIKNQGKLDINIYADKNNRLLADIVDKNGNVVYSKKENVLRGLLNLSPIKFLAKMSKIADYYAEAGKFPNKI